MDRKWWKEAVIYQIYPRSFSDSNGDGIGDLRGIIQRLDYLKELGIDAIWLSPIFKSPNADNGYDISDYYGIMDEFGTMEDCDELIAEAGKRGIKIILDLVSVYTSDEHKWFTESKKSKNNPYSDYYIWRDAPNNWGAWFTTDSAWAYCKERGQYYLHLFTEKQPDLNWENEEMRSGLYQMMNWWLDKGIGGFRMDVICHIAKHPDFPDGEVMPGRKFGEHWDYISYLPRMHDFLREMNEKVLSKRDIMTVGEIAACSFEEYDKMCNPDRNEINMGFHFHHMRIGDQRFGRWIKDGVYLTDAKKIFDTWQKATEGRAWNTLVWSNHDSPRAVSRYGDEEEYWKQSAKMLAMCQYLLKGTVYIYQGEEIGMINAGFESMDEIRDVESFAEYKNFIREGIDEKQAFKMIQDGSRDNSRTPMQWDGSENAGFTDGTPWIGVMKSSGSINVEQQLGDDDSILNFYKKLISLKKNSKCLIYGEYRLIEDTPEEVYGYKRVFDGEEYAVICNLTKNTYNYILPKGTLLLSNYPDAPTEGIIRPYESVAIKTC